MFCLNVENCKNPYKITTSNFNSAKSYYDLYDTREFSKLGHINLIYNDPNSKKMCTIHNANGVGVGSYEYPWKVYNLVEKNGWINKDNTHFYAYGNRPHILICTKKNTSRLYETLEIRESKSKLLDYFLVDINNNNEMNHCVAFCFGNSNNERKQIIDNDAKLGELYINWDKYMKL